MKSSFAAVAVVCFAFSCLAEVPLAKSDNSQRLTFFDLPNLQNNFENYRVDPYLAKATRLQAIGKEEAGKQLANEPSWRVFVLCRMLFDTKRHSTFRAPLVGAPFFLDSRLPENLERKNDWPMEPIALVDDVPFLIVDGYLLTGSPERPDEYVRYCLANCEWSTRKFRAKTAAEKQTALDNLLASPKWKVTLNDSARKFLAAQIK